jgi:dinuclear metal center YbgI/SA1388 family protein
MHSFTLYRMSPLKISDIVGIINKKYPFVLAEEWDNVGLQVGDPTAELSRIMVALDPLPTVIDEAITQNCQLLVTHHPLIFSPLRQITASTNTGSSILKAVRGGLALLAMHTNYDIAHGGLNDLLATRIGLHTTRPLKITARDELVKLVVFVPAEQFDMVRLALLPHTAAIGNYRNCSFSAAGEGTFLPLEGARPAIGSIGTMETVMEQRLELLIRRDQLAKAVKTMLSVHPYEEPAFDCYPLLNESSSVGLGRIGRLAEQTNLGELATTIGQQLGCTDIRLVGDPARKISTVAVCSGSGASLLHDAVRAGADLLLTGDVKYHEAREAELQGIAVLDAGHFPTEQLMVDAIRAYLETSLATSGCQLEIVSSRREQNPFTNVVIR